MFIIIIIIFASFLYFECVFTNFFDSTFFSSILSAIFPLEKKQQKLEH